MTSWRFGFLLAVFATCTVWAGGPPDFTRGPEAWAKATLPQSELASLRFEVEMRRAGGPRPVLLETIFKEAGLSADRMWPLWLREACRRRLVDCNAFLRDPRAEGDKELQKIAAIQALGTQARKALYREALRREADTYAPGELRGFDAAMYALAEGMDDLLPDVRRWVGRRTVEQGSARVAERLTLYEAERSSNPAVAVLGSIRRACRDDVDDLLKHDPGHLRSNQLEAEVALARAAFDVLRKLDPPDVLPELKALYGGYRHVAEDYRRRAGEHRGDGRQVVGRKRRVFGQAHRHHEIEVRQLLAERRHLLDVGVAHAAALARVGVAVEQAVGTGAEVGVAVPELEGFVAAARPDGPGPGGGSGEGPHRRRLDEHTEGSHAAGGPSS